MGKFFQLDLWCLFLFPFNALGMAHRREDLVDFGAVIASYIHEQNVL